MPERIAVHDGRGGCLYDSQVPTNKKGKYTIVTSLPGDRPSNAKTKCGVGYIPWPENGDGAGHLDDSVLIMRNMLPASNFHHGDPGHDHARATRPP